MKKLVIGLLLAMGCGTGWAQSIVLDHTEKECGEVQLGTTVSDKITVTASDLTGDIKVSLPVCSGVTVSTKTITKEQAEAGAEVTVTLTPEELESNCEVITFTAEGETNATYTLRWTPVEEKVDPVFPDHVLTALPYKETFSDATHYDGKTQLPKGWTVTGIVPFVTACAPDEIAPKEGDYYMVTSYSEEPRNEKVYTSFFNMEKDKDYKVSFWLYMPGQVYAQQQRLTNLHFGVCTEQDKSMVQDTLVTVTGESITDWKQYQVVFRPEADDEYCFAFLFSSENAYAGYIAVDDFEVTTEGAVFPPIANFSYRSFHDCMSTNTMVVSSRKTVHFVNLSEGGETYLWECPGAKPETSTDVNPDFYFPADGDYTMTMTAYNKGGKETVSRDFSVENISAEDQDYLLLHYDNEQDDEMVTSYTDTPTFPTDETYDFISGINHYYKRFAERFEFSDFQELTITGINWWMTSYSRQPMVKSGDRNWPFSIVFYGEKDGTVDTDNVFGKKVSTVVDELGSTGVGLDNSKMANFDLSQNSISVKGNFYIAFEFDDSMPVESGDSQIQRNFVAMGLKKHKNGETSLYCLPTSGPEGFTPDGKWHKVSELGDDYAGYGLILTMWCKAKKDDSTRIEEFVLDPETGLTKAYNLSGQQVGSQYNGVVIVNGKKIIK